MNSSCRIGFWRIARIGVWIGLFGESEWYVADERVLALVWRGRNGVLLGELDVWF